MQNVNILALSHPLAELEE